MPRKVPRGGCGEQRQGRGARRGRAVEQSTSARRDAAADPFAGTSGEVAHQADALEVAGLGALELLGGGAEGRRAGGGRSRGGEQAGRGEQESGCQPEELLRHRVFSFSEVRKFSCAPAWGAGPRGPAIDKVGWQGGGGTEEAAWRRAAAGLL